MGKIVSVIDIGSNSARMAIFKRTSRFGFHLLLESKSRVRISEGCYENNGILQKIPMNRALGAIKDFIKIAKKYKATKIFCIATSAVRDAPNNKEFVYLVRKQTGIHIKVIDGQKEAFYGAIACANLLYTNSGVTIDIGGGSTECAILRNGVIEQLISINIGTIRVKELFFDAKEDISKAKKFISNQLGTLSNSFINSAKELGVIFGIGGTIRTLSKLIIKKEKYPLDSISGFEFNVDKYMEFFQSFCYSNISQIKKLGMSADREDNIRSGTLIFFMLLDLLKIKKVITSGVGVREGVFISDLLRNQNYKFPINFNPSFRSLQDRFLIENKYSNVVKNNATKIFNTLKNILNISDVYLKHLQISSTILRMGNYLSGYLQRQHSIYFLLNGLNYGYSHIDKVIMYTLVKYNNKKISKNDELLKLLPSLSQIQSLCFILSIADLVSITNEVFDYHYDNGKLYIKGVNSFLIKERVSSLHKAFPILVKIL